MSETVRRLLVVGIVVAGLVGGLVADRTLVPEPSTAASAEVADPMPVAGGLDVVSETWFCAGATAAADGIADGTVVVANPTDRELTGSVTVVPSEGDARTVPLTVPSAARATVRHADVVQAPYAAALVELDGGGAVVEHTIAGPAGIGAAPCATAASDEWYLAGGSTAREDTMLLALYNPFPDDAIVDLSFATAEGKDTPQAFRGLIVRGGRLVVVNVGDHLRRRDQVATRVTTRTGRLVVDRIQLRGTVPAAGLSLTLAAPSAGEVWWFPEGLVGEGLLGHLHLFNPTDREALVEVAVVLGDGDAEPFELTVPANDRLTLDLGAEERVPKGVAHSVEVRSLNGVPVVAEQTIGVATAERKGAEDVLGGRLAARRWALAAGDATASVDEWVTVQNTSAEEATVRFTVLAGGQRLVPENLSSVVVPPGRRASVRLTDHIGREGLSLVVEADRRVVVARSLYRVGGAGLSATVGVPLPDVPAAGG